MAMRNYRAMGPEKLARCYAELAAQSGDAYDRVVVKGEDLDAHLNAARAAASSKGIDLEIPAEAQEPSRPRPQSSVTAGLVKSMPPMLAYDVNGDFGRVPKNGWVMEPKFDGWRWQVHVVANDPFGVLSVGGRNGKRHDGEAPQVDDWLTTQLLALPVVLDGEIIWEGGLPGSKIAIFVAFDVLVLEGEDVRGEPWHQRRTYLEQLIGDQAADSPVRLSPTHDVSEELFDEWIELGMEGCVAKRKDGSYLSGSRRQDGWLKVKPQATTDAIVRGTEAGKGASNKKRVGALVIELIESGQLTSCAYDCSPAEGVDLIGKRIEIAHYGWMKDSGKVRHPIFKRFRPDMELAR